MDTIMTMTIPGSLSVPSHSQVNGSSQSRVKQGKESPEEIKKAASQFEAVLIGQLLQSARSADGTGWMDNDESEPGSNLTEMSEQALSSALAANGGLGLAKMITAGLVRSVATASH
jgi:Rod binding domain-containing protein